MSKNIVVVGAGVSGLTTAVSLLQAGHKNVRVVSKHVPGDLSSEYTSPWAGASILTVAEPEDHRLQEIDMYTMKEFGRLAKEEPEAYVMVCDGIQYNEEPALPGQDPLWLKKIYKDVKEIPKEKLIKGAVFGYTFQSYTANVPKYLAWLVKTLERLGGTLERLEFKSLNEVIETFKDADVVVNCTGLGSYYLEDVKDHTMYPIRGQTITVHAPHIKKQHYIDAENRWTYIIPREDGSVICGGTVDRENRQTSPDPSITKEILRRCYNLCPEITHGKGPDAFEIIRYNVGFRPGRKDGIRLEKEHKLRSNGQKVVVVHNYGHSSHGYQSSWGSSKKAVELVNDERLSKL